MKFNFIENCPLCNSTDTKLLFKAKDLLMGKSGVFEVIECNICNYRYTNPQPSSESIFEYYTSGYPSYKNKSNILSKTSNSLMLKKKKNLYFQKHINDDYSYYGGLYGSKAWITPKLERNSKVLELGCGNGNFINYCVNNGWDVYGTDINLELKDKVNQLGGTFIKPTLPKLNFQDNYFDALFSWQVLEHLYNPKTVCQEIFRVLKPGGYFIFSVPNSNCWQFKLFKSKWAGLQVPTHLSHFCEKSIRKLLESSNMELQKIYGQNTIGCLYPSILIYYLNINPMRNQKSRDSFVFKSIDRIFGILINSIFSYSQAERLTVIARKPL